MNKKIIISLAILTGYTNIAFCETNSFTRWYQSSESGSYSICNDRDGYIVTKPDNSIDAHGFGYSLDKIMSQYGLTEADEYKITTNDDGCSDA